VPAELDTELTDDEDELVEDDVLTEDALVELNEDEVIEDEDEDEVDDADDDDVSDDADEALTSQMPGPSSERAQEKPSGH